MIRDNLHLKAREIGSTTRMVLSIIKGNIICFTSIFPMEPVGDHALGTCGQQRPGALGTSGNCGIPYQAYDRNGIFSGSALEIDGKLHLYYTAVRYLESNEEDIHCSWNDCYEASQP